VPKCHGLQLDRSRYGCRLILRRHTPNERGWRRLEPVDIPHRRCSLLRLTTLRHHSNSTVFLEYRGRDAAPAPVRQALWGKSDPSVHAGVAAVAMSRATLSAAPRNVRRNAVNAQAALGLRVNELSVDNAFCSKTREGNMCLSSTFLNRRRESVADRSQWLGSSAIRRLARRWKNAINLPTDDGVTFASAFFDALAVQDFNSAARVPDQSRLLQRVRTQRHR
jgi:hypothetical protein